MRSVTVKYLSSWWTTAGLVLACAAAYIVCLFGASPYADWTGFLFHRPAGLFLYCALILNLLLASLRIASAKLSRPAITLAVIQAMDVHTTLPVNPDVMNTLTASLTQKGFIVAQKGLSVRATMNHYSFLPGTVLRLGIVVLLAAVLLSVHTRKSAETILHEGDAIGPPGKELTLKSITADLPTKFLQVGEESTFRLNSVQAVLQSADSTETVTAGFPVRISRTYYRVTHFGFTLPVLLTNRSGVLQKNLDLDILPPGTTDSVDLQSQDLIMTISLQPERTVTKGLIKGREYDLKNPSFHIVVQKRAAKEKIGELNISGAAPASTSDLPLSFGRHAFYAKIQSTSDPALPFMYAGAFVSLFGMLLMCSRFFWYGKELLAVRENDTLHVGYREEFFKKWGIQKFYDWTTALSEARGSDDTADHPSNSSL